MKIDIKDGYGFDFITNDSRVCEKNGAFLITPFCEKYLNDALKKTKHKIYPKDLHKYISIDNIKIIGITGTNGKTTVSSILSFVFTKFNYKCAFLGTRGFFIDDVLIENTNNTTPDLLEVYYYIQKAKKLKCEFFIMEISSHAIVQNRIAGINFETKAHTNITQDHLDFHKNIEKYREIKNSFLKNSKNIIINKDDKYVKYEDSSITYSLDSDSNFQATNYNCGNDKTIATIKYKDETSCLSSKLIGKFNLSNILACISILKISLNKNLSDICDNISLFKGIEGRMEIVNTNPLIIVDFAHTPDAMENIYEIFNKQKILVIFGAGGDRDTSKRKLMGKVSDKYAKKIYLTNDNPRCENEKDIVNNIIKGIKNKDKVNIVYNRKDAIKSALGDMKNNLYDVLLIMGKGSEKYQEIHNKKVYFNDKDTVLNYINS